MIDTAKYVFEKACFSPWLYPKKISRDLLKLTAALGIIGIGLTAFQIGQSAQQMSKNSSIWGSLPSLISAFDSIETLKKIPGFCLKAAAATATAAVASATSAFCLAPQLLLQAYHRGFQLKEKIASIEAQGGPDWQEKAAKTVRQSRENLPVLEEERLRGASVLSEEMRSKIETATDSAQARILLAQAFEIQKIFGNTHYVFIHAQRQAYYPIATIYKQLAKTNSTHFKHLRENGPIDPTQNIQKYNSGILVDDASQKDSNVLISCSANFLDNIPWESALFFLTGNTNVTTLSQSDSTIIANTGKISSSQCDKIAAKIPPSPTGNLLVFCIPKHKIDEIAYRAHPGGTACQCVSAEQQKKTLDRWQLGISHKGDSCYAYCGAQYRIFLPAFRKESGCRLYYLTPHAKPIRTKIKQAAKEALIRSKL